MPDASSSPEPEMVSQVIERIVKHPWQTFVVDWNWKTALLSALFRGALFALAPGMGGPGLLRSVLIEMAFRGVVGGFWGSLLQAFRAARPAWLAGLFVGALLPASAHALEFAFLEMGKTARIGLAMAISISFSVASLLFNWLLMRKGLMVTGKGAATLASDLRRIPSVLAGMFTARRSHDDFHEC